MKIAFIGTGVMGSAMAVNLLKHQHEVHVYNRTLAKAQALKKDGAIVHDNLIECVRNKEIVLTMVGYPQDVEEVYEVIFTAASRGTIAVDMTTSSPTLAVQLYEKGKEYGISVLDAPVSGGDTGAKQGTLSIMVGGDQETYKKVEPILACMGTNLVYMGPAGSGQHTKMANQIAIAGTIAAVSEAMVYAEKCGLDVNALLQAISAGAAGSWQMNNTAPRMLKGDFAPGFYIKHFIKDMTLAREEAKCRNLDLPILNETREIYESLAAEGLENEGTQAIWKYYHKDKE